MTTYASNTTLPTGAMLALSFGRVDQTHIGIYRTTRPISQDDATKIVKIARTSMPKRDELVQKLVDQLGLELLMPNELVVDLGVIDSPCLLVHGTATTTPTDATPASAVAVAGDPGGEARRNVDKMKALPYTARYITLHGAIYSNPDRSVGASAYRICGPSENLAVAAAGEGMRIVKHGAAATIARLAPDLRRRLKISDEALTLIEFPPQTEALWAINLALHYSWSADLLIRLLHDLDSLGMVKVAVTYPA